MAHLRRGVVTIIVPVLVVVVALGAARWAGARQADARTPLASALDALPAGTQVAGFTDWAAIRAGLDPAPASEAAERTSLAEDASLRDLTTRSVLGQSIDRMHRQYGWSAADLEWEVLGQEATGAVLVARLTRSVSLDDVEDRLPRLGYVRTGDSWQLGSGGRTSVGPDLASVLGSLTLLRRERLVVATARSTGVAAIVATIRGGAPSLLGHRAVAEVAGALAGSDTALLQAREPACRSTSTADEGADVRDQARAAIARAGPVVSPSFAGRGLVEDRPRQTIRFALGFDSPAAAAEQAVVRSALGRGAFIGRTGTIEDSLDLSAAEVHGSTLTLRFVLDPGGGSFMSGEGPLLFAGCGV